MTTLVFDTETTGFVDPFIVQLAAILVEDGSEVASMNVTIRPEGWTVPQEASNVHGISTEQAQKRGVPVYSALWLFDELCAVADIVIAHNLSYDSRVLHGEYKRLEKVWTPKASFCTMLALTPLCKLPSKRRGQFKWPKLSESHIWAFGEDFDGQHDALSDVRACHRLYQYLVTNNHIK